MTVLCLKIWGNDLLPDSTKPLWIFQQWGSAVFKTKIST